jgi:hypothetical protein
MNLVWGVGCILFGIIAVNTQQSSRGNFWGGAPVGAAGHTQNVIVGILLLTMGAMFLYSYFKKR